MEMKKMGVKATLKFSLMRKIDNGSVEVKFHII